MNKTKPVQITSAAKKLLGIAKASRQGYSECLLASLAIEKEYGREALNEPR